MMNYLPNGFKLIFTIVKKGLGHKVVKAAKKAGAEGSTILLGSGTAPPGTFTFWGVELEPEKEVVLIMVPEEGKEQVFKSIRRIAKLHVAGTGISFIIDVAEVAGCVHLSNGVTKFTSKEKSGVRMGQKISYDLIVTIVNKGFSGEVIEASRQAGAEGGTIMSGRGSGIHETGSLFSINIEPEKEIILTLVDKKVTDKVLESIMDRTDLSEPGNGIAFVLQVEDVAGIAHEEVSQ